jgi:hypothetical protein
MKEHQQTNPKSQEQAGRSKEQAAQRGQAERDAKERPERSDDQSNEQSVTSSGRAKAPSEQPMTQNTLRRSLQQAGFQNVQVLDAAYLVRAKTEDGNDVIMFINPPHVSSEDKKSDSAQDSRNTTK